MTNEIFTQGCPFCGASKNDIAVSKCLQEVKIVCLKCSAEFTLANHFRNEKQAVVNAWNTRAERTCNLDGTIKWDWDVCGPYWQHELSCGHVVTTMEPEPPNYCEECGAKVVEQ